MFRSLKIFPLKRGVIVSHYSTAKMDAYKPAHVLFPSYQHYNCMRHWQNGQNNLISTNELIYPIFISDNENEFKEIENFHQQYNIGCNKIVSYLEPLLKKGLKSVLLFGAVNKNHHLKDINGKLADCGEHSPVIKAIEIIKKNFGNDLLVITDVCICGYTSTGQCGIMDENNNFDIDRSIERLADISLSYVQAGADIVAPSDMLDNRVEAIYERLIKHRYRVPIMAYSSKFGSCFYGPFRDACKSNYQGGGVRANQLPPSARDLAERAIKRDEEQGASFIIVKPGMPYLDVICRAKSVVFFVQQQPQKIR